jgi:hypothetical protein
MSSSAIMSSMEISRASSTISVRRGSPNWALISASSDLDDVEHQPLAGQDLLEARDVQQDVAVLLHDLLALEAGQPLQAHV